MGLFQRLRALFPQRKSASIFYWPTWRQGVPLWHAVDYESYAREGYDLNTLVYSAVMYKCRALTAAPIRAYTGDPEHPDLLPPDNPLAQLLDRPNPWQSQVEMQAQATVYLNIGGNVYYWLDRGGRPTGPVKAMYVLRPDRVFVVPGRDEKTKVHTLRGYVYVPEGRNAFFTASTADRQGMLENGAAVPIDPADMIHVKLSNPLDPLEGLGEGIPPLAPGGRIVDVDNSVTHFLQLFFRAGVSMPGILTTDQRLQEGVPDLIRERWQEAHGGYEKWGSDIAILEQGATYQRIGLSFQEMGFDVLDARNESRVLGPFGVPPILIGAKVGLDRSTFCLPAEAEVSTPMGPVEIGQLTAGDVVWSVQDGELCARQITAWARTGVKQLYRIQTTKHTLLATGNHPILTHSGWVRVDHLRPNDHIAQLIDSAIVYGPILGIEQAHTAEVFDITVAEGHCFIADGIVVHNSNYGEARVSFWEDTMMPEQMMYGVEFTYYLSYPDQGWFPAYDYSKVPAFREQRAAERGEFATAFQTGAITRNEYRQVLGLNPVPRGDVYIISPAMLEVPLYAQRRIEAPGEEEPVPADEDAEGLATVEDETRKGRQTKSMLSAEQKAATWKRIDRVARSWEPDFADAAEVSLEHDRAALLAILNTAKRLFQRRKSTPDWTRLEYDWSEYFGDRSEEQWRQEFIPIIQGVIEDQGERWNAQFGMKFDVQNLFAQAWYEDYILKFAQPIVANTSTDINDLLQEAMREGWTIDKMAKRLNILFDAWEGKSLDGLGDDDAEWIAARRPAHRLQLIARTETMRASNAGSHYLFQSWGSRYKEWLATADNRTRDTHMDAWAMYREGGNPGPIPMEEPYTVGGYPMMYPGDPNAPVKEVANCRCTELPYDPQMFG